MHPDWRDATRAREFLDRMRVHVGKNARIARFDVAAWTTLLLENINTAMESPGRCTPEDFGLFRNGVFN